MWTPNSIEELLSERIEFCENYLNSCESSFEHQNTVTDFTIALADYKYCKKLFEALKDNPNDNRSKTKFKKLAIKIIMDIYHQTELQTHKVISIHGVVFPSKEKERLPQENKDNCEDLIVQLEKIFREVNSL